MPKDFAVNLVEAQDFILRLNEVDPNLQKTFSFLVPE